MTHGDSTSYDDTEIQEKISKLNTKDEMIKATIDNAIPNEHKEGSNITLNDTIEARFKELQIFGNSLKETIDIGQYEIKNCENSIDFKITNNIESTNEDYKEQSFTFPLKQKFMKESYLAHDGIHHIRKQIELNGTETSWIATTNADGSIRFVLSMSDVKPNPPYSNDTVCTILSSHYNSTNNYRMYQNAEEGIAIHNNSSQIMICDKRFTNIEEFKTYLSEQKANETPVVVEYDLIEEEVEEYNEEQQTVYEQIKNTAKSYKDATHIFCTNETPCVFKAEILIDVMTITKKEIENTIGNIDTILDNINGEVV